ncbi:MAG: response regulator [Thermodesulfobacteriota bacterium]|nr:response regulator [Thermodesulfobacteriota bacterium]
MNAIKARILVVDDNAAIHEDFKKILYGGVRYKRGRAGSSLENELFGDAETHTPKQSLNPVEYVIDDAYQGEEAIAMVDAAEAEGFPYSLAFMDVRMPPGMDGIQAIKQIWEHHRHLEMVICTAYSDYSWDQILDEFGVTDHLLFIKKPYDPVTVQQTTLTLVKKWELAKENQKHLDRLEKEVEKRTAELNAMVAHLKKMKDEAEAATHAKGRFLSNMTHEIRTPLNGIMGMAQLLMDTDLTHEQVEYVETIRVSGDSLLYVINDVLDYSKIEAGKMVIENIHFKLRTTIENVIDIISVGAYAKGIEIATLIHGAVPDNLIGDPGRIRQILINLLSNAAKFTDSGEIELFIRCAPPETKTGAAGNGRVHLLFEVKDTGIGMTEAQTNRLFKPFEQADDSTTRQYGGTGLGLAISKHLCDLMDGKIGVESQLNAGSRFWFTAALGTNGGQAFDVASFPESVKGLNCLVAGDNKTSVKVISLYVNAWGGRCEEAQTVDAALERLNRKEDDDIDAIIVDFKPNNLEAYLSFAKKVRQNSATEDVALICLTTGNNRGDARKAREHGYNAYLTKPIKQSHLYNTLIMVGNARHGRVYGGRGIISKHVVDEVFAGHRRILVAEDNRVNQKVISKVLTNAGATCDVVENGRLAVAAFRKNEYDLILMDCLMPEMDGYLAAQEIRRLEPEGNRIPIIAITADAFADNRAKCEAAGMDDFIFKPFKVEAVVETLKRIFDSQG